jgi:hypothetical protein
MENDHQEEAERRAEDAAQRAEEAERKAEEAAQRAEEAERRAEDAGPEAAYRAEGRAPARGGDQAWGSGDGRND